MDPTESEDFNAAIKEAGKARKDFSLSYVEDDYPPDSIHLVKTTITVTYGPTGKSKSYEGGYGSTWPADFDSDLRTGFYY